MNVEKKKSVTAIGDAFLFGVFRLNINYWFCGYEK